MESQQGSILFRQFQADDSLIVKYPFNPYSPRRLKLISSWSLKEVSTHTLTQTGQNCCFLALRFF